MKILCVIPSRLGSTRLPRKPLALIKGKPMIQHVYEAAIQCPEINRVIVATDSGEIAEVINAIGGEAMMTDSNIETGSDRVAVAADCCPDMDVIINLQGDQPFVKPHMLMQLIAPYVAGENPEMTTLACPLDFATEYTDPSVVKVVMDQSQNAIYFSRAPIPYFRNQLDVPVRHHLGLYAFRRDFLNTYTTLIPTPLEKAEALEQLRVLEHGYRIKVCHTEHKILEINTPEDLARANSS